MSQLKSFFYPETLDEVIEILQDETIKTAVIAGGTSLTLSLDSKIEALIDITRMGYNFIKEEGGYVVVGATTPITDIQFSPDVGKLADGMVSKAASLIGSKALRNMITLGGNIVQLQTWSDMPTVLLALDASIKIRGDEERIVPAADFFKEHPKKILEPFEVVTQVIFPKTPANSGGEFIKFSRTTGDYSIATVGCYLEFEEGLCSLARVAIGSVEPLPRRCRELENMLENQEVTSELIEEVAQNTYEHISPVSNIWGSAEYKQQLVEKLIKRALNSCLEKAKAKKEQDKEEELE